MTKSRNRRIISIVDDDQSFRVALENLVRALGMDAKTFTSAEEFLRSPYLKDTACVISDVQMPGMNGIDMQEHLAVEHTVPVIFVTAFPNAATEQRAIKAGAVCFLHKPFESQVLIKCISKALKDPDIS